MTPPYILPNSPSQRCLDRFSLLDDAEDESGLTSLWLLIQEVLKQPVHSPADLVEVLDTIANLIRGTSGISGDYGSLKTAVETAAVDFYTKIWPKIASQALKMSEVFPAGQIAILEPNESLRLSRNQAACLVAHQFLCTLTAPPWRDDFFDFSIWYGSNQRHPRAVDMYLAALFAYFADLDLDIDSGVEYSLCSFAYSQPMPTQPWNIIPLSAAKVVCVQRYSTKQQGSECQNPDGAVVISANKDIGFGQSATQEEIFVGNCPEACPAVLVTPTLKPDQALVVNRARPMLCIEGQRRDVFWTCLPPEERRGGRMLFMDALEIDEVDNDDDEMLADLKPHNVERELRKAYTGFSSWSNTKATIWTGVWGCGAFNGDPAVKMCILWMAASLAGKELYILCDPLHGDFAKLFAEFVQDMKGLTVEDVQDRLDGLPRTTPRLQAVYELTKHGTNGGYK